MIKSEREYKVTKKAVDVFAANLKTLEAEGSDDWGSKAATSSLGTKLGDLREQVREWEDLRSGGVEEIGVDNWDDLPKALVKARIAQGLTQQQLGERLGLRKQQIQKWEDEGYEHAEFWRVADVADALGVSLTGKAKLAEPTLPDIEAVADCMEMAGMNREFINLCVTPTATAYPDRRQAAEAMTSRIREIWNASPQEVLAANSNDPIWLRPVVNCRFKRPINARPTSVAAYASYSRFLLSKIGAAFPAWQSGMLPAKPADMRRLLFGNGLPTFKGALECVWRMGVPVLPIASKGGFHGAAFIIEGRPAIALKQSVQSPARWLFDLTHELGHLAENQDTHDFASIEADSNDDLESEEEIRAHRFAAQVLLHDNYDGLFAEVWKRASGRPERLKNVTLRFAQETGIDLGLLAQHVAFRVKKEHKGNWYGTATKLEAATESPFHVAKQVMLEHINLAEVQEPAYGMLVQVLA